jgi:hypothetical protein
MIIITADILLMQIKITIKISCLQGPENDKRNAVITKPFNADEETLITFLCRHKLTLPGNLFCVSLPTGNDFCTISKG